MLKNSCYISLHVCFSAATKCPTYSGEPSYTDSNDPTCTKSCKDWCWISGNSSNNLQKCRKDSDCSGVVSNSCGSKC